MFVLAFLLIVLIYALANFYIGRKLYKSFKLVIPNLSRKVFLSVYGGFALITIASFLGAGGIVKYINAYWMGLFCYLFVFSVICDLVFLVFGKKYRNYKGFVALFLSACFVIFGLFNAASVKNTKYTVDLENCDMKIVLISDLHLGAVGSEKRLEKVIDEVNKKNSDIVCIVGDIFDNDFYEVHDTTRVKELLSSVNSKYGVYACLGNHDTGKTVDRMISFIDECGITLLKDEYAVIDEKLILCGRLDSHPIGEGLKRGDITKYFKAWETLDLPVVIMDHNPGNIREYGEEVDLIVCGHTHKGQLFPANFITNMIFDVDYGHFKRDEKSPDVIVTSGAGTWGMPIRVGSYCEVVTISV